MFSPSVRWVVGALRLTTLSGNADHLGGVDEACAESDQQGQIAAAGLPGLEQPFDG
jgi:hypothetical protein